jgi:hypothetical protein
MIAGWVRATTSPVVHGTQPAIMAWLAQFYLR